MGLLSVNDAVKALNQRELTESRPDRYTRILKHEQTDRQFEEFIVPGIKFFIFPKKWYILQNHNGKRRNYCENYSRAIRHFEYLTRET